MATGCAYFFKGDRYLRYNIATDFVDVGPVEIATFWTHLPAEFQGGLDAVVNWGEKADLAALMRAAGLSVNEVGNWQTRVSGSTFTPVGIVIHHTGPGASVDLIVNGRPDLSGPLANFYVEKNATINLISGGHANHAGPGAQVVLDEVQADIAPADTAQNRGLHDGPSGNSFFYGFENQNAGNGVDPWPEEQLDAIAHACAALCRVHCWTSSRVIGHKEWTARKPDPLGIDMNDFRARVDNV
jgi:hypothetical protein